MPMSVCVFVYQPMSVCTSLCPHVPTASMCDNSVHAMSTSESVSMCVSQVLCVSVLVHVCQQCPCLLCSCVSLHISVCHCVHVCWLVHVPVCLSDMFLCMSQLITQNAYQTISMCDLSVFMYISPCHVTMFMHACAHICLTHACALHVCIAVCIWAYVYARVHISRYESVCIVPTCVNYRCTHVHTQMGLHLRYCVSCMFVRSV